MNIPEWLKRGLEKFTGKPLEHIEADAHIKGKVVLAPIDFNKLIAEGKLERISRTKYRLLVPLNQIPENVRHRVFGIESEDVEGKQQGYGIIEVEE